MPDLFSVEDRYGTHVYDRDQRVYLAICGRTGRMLESVGAPAKVSDTGHHIEQHGFRETRVQFIPRPGVQVKYGPNEVAKRLEDLDEDLRTIAIEVDAKGRPVKDAAPAAAPAKAAPAK